MNSKWHDDGKSETILLSPEQRPLRPMTLIPGRILNDVDLDRLADRLADKLEERMLHAVTPRLMNLAETAKYIGRSLAAVKQLVQCGKIPVTRFDEKLMVDRRALDRLIEEHTGRH